MTRYRSLQHAPMLGMALALCFATPTHADVVISKKATANMSCAGGLCSLTAKDAVLNATDLANMLGSGDVTVTTGGITKDIEVHAPLSWAAASRLTLDAQRSVIVKSGMSVTGTGALTVTTNDGGGKSGEFVIVPEQGSVQFWDLSSSLVIDGQTYTLVGDIQTLAADIASNPSGFYALAKPYDASVDGWYATPPISGVFAGAFEGMGNPISHLTVHPTDNLYAALFYALDPGSEVADLNLTDASIGDGGGTCESRYYATIAIFAEGSIERASATGTITNFAGCGSTAGGLVALNSGTISSSSTKVRINASYAEDVGGLAGFNEGTISTSFSVGRVYDDGEYGANVGGLVGRNFGSVNNSYSFSPVTCSDHWAPNTGGLVGENNYLDEYPALATNSYAIGHLRYGRFSGGGIAGHNGVGNQQGLVSDYWDTETTGAKRGCDNGECPYVYGLITQEFRSALPRHFSPKVWAINPKINKGYPYLIANPPPK